MFGGRAAGVPLGDLWEFDPAGDSWTELASTGPRPQPRFGHNAIYDAARGWLVVALGQAGTAFLDDVWAFQVGTGTWTRIGEGSTERPQPRYGSAAGFDPVGGRLLISHGFTDRGRFDDTWALDLAADSWTRVPTVGEVPIKRCLARAHFNAALGRLLVFGGQTDSAPFLGDLWSLEISRGTWTDLSHIEMPPARHLYGATATADGAWHIVGGNTPTGPNGEHWVYQPSLNAWQLGNALPARASHDAAILGDSLYLFGGTDGINELNDVWSVPLVQ